MYDTHNPMVRRHAQANAKNLEQVIAFVFASIRVQTSMLPRMMKEFRKRGVKSSWIWGNKRTGIDYVRKHRQDLFDRMTSILRAKKANCALELMMLFLEVPGLGLPKAGFVVQLVAGKSGCMDVHNLRRYLPNEDSSKGTPSWLQTSGNSDKTKRIKASAYLELVDESGGTRKMWNGWCTHLQILYPHHFKTPDDVSALHMCIW